MKQVLFLMCVIISMNCYSQNSIGIADIIATLDLVDEYSTDFDSADVDNYHVYEINRLIYGNKMKMVLMDRKISKFERLPMIFDIVLILKTALPLAKPNVKRDILERISLLESSEYDDKSRIRRKQYKLIKERL